MLCDRPCISFPLFEMFISSKVAAKKYFLANPVINKNQGFEVIQSTISSDKGLTDDDKTFTSVPFSSIKYF